MPINGAENSTGAPQTHYRAKQTLARHILIYVGHSQQEKVYWYVKMHAHDGQKWLF